MRKRVLDALRQPSLKLTIIAIVFVVLVPTLGVLTATLYGAGQSFHDAGARQLLETARTVARSAITELELTGSVLQGMSQMHAEGDDANLHLHSVSSFAYGRLETHVLVRAEGQWSMGNDNRADAVVRQLVSKAAATGLMQVSDIVMPTELGQGMQVVLAVPSAPSQNMVEVSTLTTQPEHFLQALTRRGDAGSSVILAITDGQGRILDRSVDGARFVGKPVPDWKTLQAQPGSSGSFTAKTLEGKQIIFAFERIEGTPGWVAVVGESADSFNSRWQQPISVMLTASAVAICMGLLLAMWLARKALQPISLLATRAQRIAADQGRGGQRLMADVPPTFVAEFEVLRQSLDQADQALQHSLQESRRAERAAQEHLSVLQAAEEQARLGHWSLDVASGQLWCSDMLSVLSGAPRRATVMHVDELRSRLKAPSYERVHAAVRRCIDHGEPYSMEVEHLRRDGSMFAAYLRGTPVYGAEGRVVGITGTLQDISEGKEQNDRLAAVADNLPSGVIFRLQRPARKDLLLQFLSAGLEALSGFSASATMGHQGQLLQSIPSSHLRRLLRVLCDAKLPGHVLDDQFPLRTLHGPVVWIHVRAALRYPNTGGAVWDGIARDVTAERATDDALRTAKEAAEMAERAKSDFLATMSHEIRTPMNSVIGMARLAMRTPLDPKQRNYLEKINESANVLLAIINDILDFSKIEAGGLVLEAVPFRLETVLDTVAAVTVLKAEEKGLEVTFSVSPDVPTMVRGDALRLGQVLTNLVSNAVKFTERGDVVVRISVDAAEQGPLLHFAVSDSGIGLSPEQARSLFQPFTQAQSDTSRNYGGTGLGLAISKRLVELMGGSIGVDSAQGRGSTFFFTVRMPAAEAGAAVPYAAQARDMALQGRRILITDDNSTSRMALAEMAESFGMETTLAGNGQEALDLLRDHAGRDMAFDMVVLDWRMPVMDGVEAARQIKADAQLERMPAVLMVTAYGQDAMLQACEGVELQGVLLKPVTQSAMFNTLLQASSGLSVQSALRGKPAYEPSDLRAFAALRGMRVLVADDNALNREVARDFLTCVGVQVYTAVDGLDAIRCLQAQDMDAVLMDIQMPHMDGLAATREIRRHVQWQQLPIIALSAQARSEDVLLSREAGMDAHLTKPIDEIALYSALLAYRASVVDVGMPERESEAQAYPGPAADTALAQDAFARLSRVPARRARLLRGFLQDFAHVPAHFSQLLAHAQWQELAALVHQIKGSASYLDAMQLYAVADVVEVAARGGQDDVVRRNAEPFVVQMEACLDSVRAALEALPKQAEEVGSTHAGADPHGVLGITERARPLVASGNFAAHRLLEQLVVDARGSAWESTAQAALEAFDDLEREKTLGLLDALDAQCRQTATE